MRTMGEFYPSIEIFKCKAVVVEVVDEGVNWHGVCRCGGLRGSRGWPAGNWWNWRSWLRRRENLQLGEGGKPSPTFGIPLAVAAPSPDPLGDPIQSVDHEDYDNSEDCSFYPAGSG